MKINKKFGDKIYIEWLGAYSTDGWTTCEKAMEESPNAFCRTTALYIGESKNFINVSHTQGKTKDNSVMGVLSVPKKWIRKVK